VLCLGVGCGVDGGYYDENTEVYLSDKSRGSTRDLLNYTNRLAHVFIRKTDKHVNQINLMK
jgi:hypothetical protein